jgi:O-acetylserine/cysteine efflux transporter
MPAPTLTVRDGLIALAVMAVWGTNFVVIRLGLDHLPPLLLAALRFTMALVPAVFFLKRPAVPWRYLAGYGTLIGAGQFGLLFIAMRGDITPGLASLIIQVQIFFTIGLAVYLTKERVRAIQLAALLLAVSGIVVILDHTDASTTPLGLVLVLLAALCWAGGNMVVRTMPKVNMLAFVVWASLFSAPPLYALSFLFEGCPAIRSGVVNADATTWGAVAYQAFANTLFGYAAWSWLLSRYPAATITPMALLVPVFGMGASALWLAEPLQPWKLVAAALIIGGLGLNLVWPRVAARLAAHTSAT